MRIGPNPMTDPVHVYTSIYTSFFYIRNFGPKTRVFYTLVMFTRFLSVKSGGPNAAFFCFGKAPNVHIHIYTHSVFELIKCMKPRVLPRKMPWAQKNSSLFLGSV